MYRFLLRDLSARDVAVQNSKYILIEEPLGSVHVKYIDMGPIKIRKLRLNIAPRCQRVVVNNTLHNHRFRNTNIEDSKHYVVMGNAWQNRHLAGNDVGHYKIQQQVIACRTPNVLL